MEITIIDNYNNDETKAIKENIAVIENANLWEKAINEMLDNVAKNYNLKYFDTKKIISCEMNVMPIEKDAIGVNVLVRTPMMTRRYYEIAFSLDNKCVFNADKNMQFVRMFGYSEI